MTRQTCFIKFEESAKFLIAVNLVTIAVALWGRWHLTEVMWIYWGQSVVIGYFNWKRIRSLKEFSTENFRINNRSVEPTEATKRQVSWFFALHYGAFHVAYFAFMSSEWGGLTPFDVIIILACIVLFGYNHRFSFYTNIERDLQRKPNIGTMMIFPYLRIVPMHLTLFVGTHFGGDSTIALLSFLGLKTGADVGMHLIEHYQKRS